MKTQKRKTNIYELKNKRLDRFYVTVYVVLVKVPVRKNEIVDNRIVHILYGVTIGGNKIIIGIYEEDKGDNRFWLEQIEHVKSRGLEKVLFVSMNANKKLEQAFKIVYNSVKIIPSAVDIISSMASYTQGSWQEGAEREIIKCFLAQDIEACNVQIELLRERYKDNSVMMVILDRNIDNIKSYYKFNKEFRHLFCSYFLIKKTQRAVLSQIFKYENFSSVDELISNLSDYFVVFERTRSYRRKEWTLILNEIYRYFADEIEGYI